MPHPVPRDDDRGMTRTMPLSRRPSRSSTSARSCSSAPSGERHSSSSGSPSPEVGPAWAAETRLAIGAAVLLAVAGPATLRAAGVA